MRKNKIQNVVIHNAEKNAPYFISDRIIQIYLQYIQRTLEQMNLSAEEKSVCINSLIKKLKQRQ